MPRFHFPRPLALGATLSLPSGAVRHVQVLRLQPGAAITLFNGEGGEHAAEIMRIGRSEVEVRIVAHLDVEREAARPVHLALGMPANERMDWLLEKATELGMAGLQPLQSERSVLRLSGERAEKKRGHWQGIAIAACEQCGRNRVPVVQPVRPLGDWLRGELPEQRLMLSLASDSAPLMQAISQHPEGLTASPVMLLSGPEGGLSPAEELAARTAGFVPVSLGARTLRAETAPLAALAALTL